MNQKLFSNLLKLCGKIILSIHHKKCNWKGETFPSTF
uniref:Uncharacterized protein n=1 Tax=Arundo donax TaxID=35708 RepID=A0A0A9HGN0_ARUDO